MIVVDASVVASALVDDSRHASWAIRTLNSGRLVAPAHLHVEVAQMIRRWTLSNALDPEDAVAAHTQLMSLDVALHPYSMVGDRVWELRSNVSASDAAYVALAELFDVALATLDERLAGATGPTCRFLLP